MPYKTETLFSYGTQRLCMLSSLWGRKATHYYRSRAFMHVVHLLGLSTTTLDTLLGIFTFLGHSWDVNVALFVGSRSDPLLPREEPSGGAPLGAAWAAPHANTQFYA